MLSPLVRDTGKQAVDPLLQGIRNDVCFFCVARPVPGSLSSLLHLHNRQRQPMPASMPGTLPNPTMPGSSAVLMPVSASHFHWALLFWKQYRKSWDLSWKESGFFWMKSWAVCCFAESARLSVPRCLAGFPALQCSLSEAWPHLPAGDKWACHTQGMEFVQGHSVSGLAQSLYSLGYIPSVLNSPGSGLARTQSNNYNNKNNNGDT